MYDKIKARIYSILENGGEKDILGRIVSLFLVVLIILNVLAVMLETVDGFSGPYSAVFMYFEIFSVAVFTIEYALRLWVCNVNPKYVGAAGRVKYILSPMALVDLLAILPFYLPAFIPFDLRILRMLRLFRMFRLFKLGRYNESLGMMKKVIADKAEDLSITLFIGVVILILASTAMYYAEHDIQPDKFSSIPESMYYGVITLATIGYGDVYPVTIMGKFFSAIIAITGIGMFAMPAGIISSGFVEEIQKKRENNNFCPHCGKNLEEAPVTIISQHEAIAVKAVEYNMKK